MLRTAVAASAKTPSERIDKQRVEMLERLIASVNGVVDNLCIGEQSCTFECSSILLGALLKQIQPLGLWPRPSEPYTDFSFVQITQAVQSFRSPRSEARLHLGEVEVDYWVGDDTPSYSKKMRKKRWNADVDLEPERWHKCSLGSLLIPRIEQLECSVTGLDLEDIPSSGHSPAH